MKCYPCTWEGTGAGPTIHLGVFDPVWRVPGQSCTWRHILAWKEVKQSSTRSGVIGFPAWLIPPEAYLLKLKKFRFRKSCMTAPAFAVSKIAGSISRCFLRDVALSSAGHIGVDGRPHGESMRCGCDLSRAGRRRTSVRRRAHGEERAAYRDSPCGPYDAALPLSGLFIPSFLILEARVEGFMLSISAAPSGPCIFHLDLRSASSMCCRSLSSRV